jgi:hypothetical protein
MTGSRLRTGELRRRSQSEPAAEIKLLGRPAACRQAAAAIVVVGAGRAGRAGASRRFAATVAEDRRTADAGAWAPVEPATGAVHRYCGLCNLQGSLFMRGSPAHSYETGCAHVPLTECRPLSIVSIVPRHPNDGRKQASATPHSMLRPMHEPMSKSLLEPCFKTGGPRAGGAPVCAAVGLFLSVSIATLPILILPRSSVAAESVHCLTGDEQRAATANGKTMPLATVIHALRRAPKEVVKAQLCQDGDRLIYKLTLLARDGKVKRAIVDASNGAVVGER